MDRTLPLEIIDLFRLFLARFPVPTSDEPSDEHDARVRSWTIRFAQQVVYCFPGQGYGVKKASDGRPVGKDTLAKAEGSALFAWDLFEAASSGTPRPDFTPAFHDLTDTGQVFVEVVGINHLGLVDGETMPEPKPGPTKPTPAPKPRVDYHEFIETGAEIVRTLDRQGSTHYNNPEAIGLSGFHLAWKILVEGYGLDDAVQNAENRAEGLEAD